MEINHVKNRLEQWICLQTKNQSESCESSEFVHTVWLQSKGSCADLQTHFKDAKLLGPSSVPVSSTQKSFGIQEIKILGVILQGQEKQ